MGTDSTFICLSSSRCCRWMTSPRETVALCSCLTASLPHLHFKLSTHYISLLCLLSHVAQHVLCTVRSRVGNWFRCVLHIPGPSTLPNTEQWLHCNCSHASETLFRSNSLLYLVCLTLLIRQGSLGVALNISTRLEVQAYVERKLALSAYAGTFAVAILFNLCDTAFHLVVML